MHMLKNWLPSGIVRLLALDIEVIVSYFIVLILFYCSNNFTYIGDIPSKS